MMTTILRLYNLPKRCVQELEWAEHTVNSGNYSDGVEAQLVLILGEWRMITAPAVNSDRNCSGTVIAGETYALLVVISSSQSDGLFARF